MLISACLKSKFKTSVFGEREISELLNLSPQTQHVAEYYGAEMVDAEKLQLKVKSLHIHKQLLFFPFQSPRFDSSSNPIIDSFKLTESGEKHLVGFHFPTVTNSSLLHLNHCILHVKKYCNVL